MVYIILDKESNAVKIGRTNNIEKRLENLRACNPNELKLLLVSNELNEHELHNKFAREHIRNEWYTYSANIQELIDNISSEYKASGLEGVKFTNFTPNIPFVQLEGNPIRVYLAILYFSRNQFPEGHAGHGKYARVPINRIAQMLHLSRPTIQKALNDLLVKDIVAIDKDCGSPWTIHIKESKDWSI